MTVPQRRFYIYESRTRCYFKNECLKNKREILEIFLNDVRNTMHKNFKDKETAQKIQKTKKWKRKK